MSGSAPPPATTLDLTRVAIFPLPESVLFPRTFLPLHIFEPRYRAMTQDCIDQTLPLAITLARPGADLAGHADVFPVAGVGVIERHERLPDGRFNILVRGVARMHIDEEIPHSPYRLVRAHALDDRWPAGGARALEARAETLRACVARIAALAIEGNNTPMIAEVVRRVEAAKDPALLVDTVASMFIPESSAKQSLLEELAVEARLDSVTERLAEFLLRAESVRGGGAVQ